MDHNDEQDNVKDEGTAKTASKTNGQRYQKPDRQLYGKNKEIKMSMTWQSQIRWKDDGKRMDNEGDSKNKRHLFSLTSL